MTQESIQPFLDWISAHPTWSGLAVFLISLSESLAIVGLVVPGVVMMTAIGGMMGAGHLPFFETLLWAILGAIAGDGISYWLGYHYHERLKQFWPFKQFPNLLARGETFFRNHGGKSIIFGRFVGPVRPMIPVIAGMLDMTPKRFLLFNILSALAWAPLYSLPGILIGASLGSLSPEVASRAGLLVLFLLLVLWLIYELLLFIGARTVATLNRLLDSIWAFLNRLPFIHKLLKVRQGTEQGQLGILLLGLFGFVSFIKLALDVVNYKGIAEWNEPIYQVLRALYFDKVIAWTGFLTGLGDPWVLLPAACAIAIWLIWRKRANVAGYWLLTIATGFLIAEVIKIKTAIPRPEGLVYSSYEHAFPSRHALATTLIFGFAAALIQHAVSNKHRWIPWAIAIPLILVISFSRAYLGVHWLTDILASLVLGIFSIAIATFFYRRTETKPILIRGILIPGLLVILITFGIYSSITYSTTCKEIVRQWNTHELNQKDWWHGKAETNELYRTGAFKRQATLFDIQWLGPLNVIKNDLEEAGWKAIPKLNFKTGVMILAKDPSPLSFPIMPKFHRDRLPVLTFAKALDNTQRLVLQLWQSDYITHKQQSLWVGTLRLEEETHPLPLVTLYLETIYEGNILKQLIESMKAKFPIQARIITPKETKQHHILLLNST